MKPAEISAVELLLGQYLNLVEQILVGIAPAGLEGAASEQLQQMRDAQAVLIASFRADANAEDRIVAAIESQTRAMVEAITGGRK